VERLSNVDREILNVLLDPDANEGNCLLHSCQENLGFLKPLFSKGVNDWKMISTIILFIGIEKFGWHRVDLLIYIGYGKTDSVAK